MKTKIIEKRVDRSVEAGSGGLYIPILGDIFPSLFGHKMRETVTYVFVCTDGKEYVVEELLFDRYNKGDKIVVDKDGQVSW
jgi:hypothetical protein